MALTGHGDPSSLSDLSRVGARAGITTGATLSGPSLASWFLDRKLGEGYNDTLAQSDWCLMFLCNQAWISLLRLPEPRANRKTVLKVKCFTEASFKGSKGAFVSWERDAPPALGSASMETVPETGEILIFANINGGVAQLGRGSRKGCPSCSWVCLYGNYPGDG